MINIDPRLVSDGITEELFQLVFNHFVKEIPRLRNLKKYYLGKHQIENREKEAFLSNIKVVTNFSKYITDMATGYFLGESINYTSDNSAIDVLTKLFKDIDLSSHDTDMEKNCSIYGKSYELWYIDKNEDGEPMLNVTTLNPESTFVVYDNTVKNNPLFGVYFFSNITLDGTQEIIFNIYTDKEIITFKENEFDKRQIVNHKIKQLPIIEILNNEDKQGDFEQVISLIDSYEMLQSDRINDKVQFVASMLILYNTDLEESELAKARENGAMSLFGENIRAEYVVKQMDENMSHILMKDLMDNIYQFSMVSNMSDELFSGNASGVALKYKLLAFENLTKIKERNYIKGLKKRLKLILMVLKTMDNLSLTINDISITFSRSLPANNKENADMIAILKSTGIITDETLASQLSFVDNAKAEVERAREREKEVQEEQDQREMRSLDNAINDLDKQAEDGEEKKEPKLNIQADSMKQEDRRKLANK